MEYKSNINMQGPPPPPPNYDQAMGFIPTQTQQQYQPTLGQPIVVPQQVIVTAPTVGPNPNPVICPHCRTQIVTRVEYEPGSKTHLIAMLLCLFGCWCCPCLPYCIDDCKNANHYCPHCGAFLGSYVS